MIHITHFHFLLFEGNICQGAYLLKFFTSQLELKFLELAGPLPRSSCDTLFSKMSNQGDNLKSLEFCLFKIHGNNIDTFVKCAST